jgi:predicted nuclease with TOPRIM domain
LKEEVQALKVSKNELLAKLKEAEDCIAELQEDASNAAEVFKNLLANMENLKQETEGLTD